MALLSSFSVAFLLLLLATVVKEIASQMPDGNSADGPWDYNATSEHGPDDWHHHYPKCGGSSQSPIDIPSVQATFSSSLIGFNFNYYDESTPFEYEIKNTGSSIQVSGGWRSVISGGGLIDDYNLEQLHFHWGKDSQEGSEHLIDTKPSPLEIHLVHYNKKYGTFNESLQYSDGLAVLGVFAQVSSSGGFSALGNLTTYFDEIPHKGNTSTVPSFNLTSLLPEHKTYYRYQGSLTTPECQESVIWTVFHNPIYLNENEIAAFRTIHDSAGHLLQYNFRPTQSLNGRVVHTSISAAAIPRQSTVSATVLTMLSVVMAIVPHNWIS